MWNTISDPTELSRFLEEISYFHDSCIKQMQYVSGAYVTEDRMMFPVNDKRVLTIVFQGNYGAFRTLEMEFSKLVSLQLNPPDEEYTCELLGCTMLFLDGNIWWADTWPLTAEQLGSYTGTVICSKEVRWRILD